MDMINTPVDDSTLNQHRDEHSSSRRILFDHVPKTGGMALHAVLQAKLGEDRCSPIITGSIVQAGAEFDRYRCVSGHFFFHPGCDLSNVWSLTVLRNPVDRIISHLLYSRYDITPTGDSFNQRNRALDLDSYINSDDPQVVGTISNTMVAHFAPLAWDGVEVLSADRKLALAKGALERFDLVGLTERLEETVDLLCWALRWPPVRELPRINVGSRKIALRDLPERSRKRLLNLNALDTELYAHARKLHDKSRRTAIFGNSGPSESSSRGTNERIAAIADDRSTFLPMPWRNKANFGSRELELVRIDVFGQIGLGPILLAGETATASVVFRANQAADDLTVGFYISDERGRLVFATNTRCYGLILEAAAGSECRVNFTFRADIGVGRYVVGASLHPSASHLPKCYHWADALNVFDVVGNSGWHFEGIAKLSPQLEFAGVTPRPDPSPSAQAKIQYLARLSPALQDFRAAIVVQGPFTTLSAGQLVAKEIEVVNAGAERWPTLGERPVRVSYHWTTPDKAVVVYDGERSHLAHDLLPGQSAKLWVSIRAPDQAGDYILQLSLVQEAVGWFEEFGGETCDMPVSVVA